jgi:hypothetical protein
MLYLRNGGGWIDFSSAIEPDQVEIWYDLERHRLRGPAEAVETRSDRWGWLSAVERSGPQRDMTPWLEGLRVPREGAVSVRVLLGLFAQQNGWVPRGVLTVTTRDGSEEQVDAATGAIVTVGARPVDVDYVR